MGTYNALYIRKQATDEITRSAILNLYPNARIETSEKFVGGVLSRNVVGPPEKRIAELSRQLATDIIWVSYQTTVEAFIFHHWKTGLHLRALEYGCAHEGIWDRVEGQPESWEQGYFWDEEDLEAHLECAETETEREKLRKLWKDRLLIQGEAAPTAGSASAVGAVMEHYGLFGDRATETRQPEAPIPASPGAIVFKVLVWVAILSSIGLILWKHSK